jgi:hypothetical protein
MAKKPTTPQDTADTIAVSAARITGAPEAPPHAKSTKIGKLPKKHKHRLPRRQKKAQLKAAGRL